MAMERSLRDLIKRWTATPVNEVPVYTTIVRYVLVESIPVKELRIKVVPRIYNIFVLFVRMGMFFYI